LSSNKLLFAEITAQSIERTVPVGVFIVETTTTRHDIVLYVEFVPACVLVLTLKPFKRVAHYSIHTTYRTIHFKMASSSATMMETTNKRKRSKQTLPTPRQFNIRSFSDALKKMVWVTVGKTEHQAWLMEERGESPTVLIRWETTGAKERVPVLSVSLQSVPSRRSRTAVKFLRYGDNKDDSSKAKSAERKTKRATANKRNTIAVRPSQRVNVTKPRKATAVKGSAVTMTRPRRSMSRDAKKARRVSKDEDLAADISELVQAESRDLRATKRQEVAVKTEQGQVKTETRDSNVRIDKPEKETKATTVSSLSPPCVSAIDARVSGTSPSDPAKELEDFVSTPSPPCVSENGVTVSGTTSSPSAVSKEPEAVVQPDIVDKADNRLHSMNVDEEEETQVRQMSFSKSLESSSSRSPVVQVELTKMQQRVFEELRTGKLEYFNSEYWKSSNKEDRDDSSDDEAEIQKMERRRSPPSSKKKRRSSRISIRTYADGTSNNNSSDEEEEDDSSVPTLDTVRRDDHVGIMPTSNVAISLGVTTDAMWAVKRACREEVALLFASFRNSEAKNLHLLASVLDSPQEMRGYSQETWDCPQETWDC
jgi:hypothetical protein